MANPDLAHRMTDQELAALEKRIAVEYKKAADKLTDKINAYFESFKKRDAEAKALIGTIVNGREYTEKDYQQWRLAQIGRGKRFEALRDRVAERMTNANKVAAAYINDQTPGIYSLNRNYSAYTIEKQVGADVGFDLWDEQTVKRLIVEEPDLMPYYPPKRAVKRGIDLAWGKRQITAQVTAGILQGESIKHLADRLQTNIPEMNRNSAIRAARTAATGAQNAGRMDSYARAEEMGIKLKKRWLATLDNRTRHAHQLLDGQTQPNDKPFQSELGNIMFPGDPNAAPANVYNCRCTLITEVEGVDTSDAKRRARNQETGESVVIEDMSYAEWAGWKNGKAEKDKKVALNKDGDTIHFSPKISGEKWETSISVISKLSSEFRTKLLEVRPGMQKSAGSVQISGTIMELSSKTAAIAAHEFAHSISIERQTKYGLYDEADFWKEVKAVQRKYKKAVAGDPSKWISSYEHSHTGADEFMAEAFSQAWLTKEGLEIPNYYGKDTTYSKMVLEIVRKYFGWRK